MRMRLKGLNTARKRLANGSFVTYYYAWEGGPPLPGKPGSPEFISAYNQAISIKTIQPEGTLLSVLRSYQDSHQFADLADRARRDYIRLIKKTETRYGDFPINALADRRTRSEFMSWRDQMAVKSRRQADYTMAVLALILAWAVDRGIVTSNPCIRPEKVYRSNRVECVWTKEQEAAFLSTAPKQLRLAYLLAVWTRQRQGDLIRLTWSAYDAKYIRLRQRKTSKRVTIPVGEPLRLILDQIKRSTLTILSTTRNTPWTESGFRASWRTARKKAKVEGVTFHDLRGTAVTRLGRADCSLPEIATVTGLSLRGNPPEN